MAEKRFNNLKNGSLANVRLLSTIFPVGNDEDQFLQDVDQVLEILCDADVSFELILISSSESNIQEENFLQLGRKYPQVHPILCPGTSQAKAISMAIRRSTGDMIVILDQGPKATTQLLNLLQDLIDRTSDWSSLQKQTQQQVDQLIAENVIADQNAGAVSSSPISFQDTNTEIVVAASLPNPGQIDASVIDRLDRWAKAIVAERDSLEKRQVKSPAAEIPQNRPFEKESKPGTEEIRRIDSKPESGGKKRLPKFITHFHEFI